MSRLTGSVVFGVVLLLCCYGGSSPGQGKHAKAPEQNEEGKCGVFLCHWNAVETGQKLPANVFIRNLSENNCELKAWGDTSKVEVRLEPGESLFSTCSFEVLETRGRVEFVELSPTALRTAVHFLDVRDEKSEQKKE